MLKVHYSRLYSALMTLCFLMVLIICFVALARTDASTPIFVKVMVWIITPGMALGMVAGIRWFINPPLMFTADRRGITSHYDARAKYNYSSRGVLLPWDAVEKLELLQAYSVSGNLGKRWVIVCRLKSPPPFPVKEHSVATGPSWGESEFCLDADNGTVTKQNLLDMLTGLWRSAATGRH